ncbi:response regulator [Dyadobacter sp. CY343]|uniref:response regulator n=1 Tax=Dyadobacter sp. CY343 TaxID=2907299 RepID=UPI001F330C42|nr:response regulator [Dyadobacter sp. CY343]MCE7059522.1 response regulator [Dyadobacter sp. CY343]
MKTIYLADDDEDDRMLIREAIERVIHDVRILEVSDGESLLAMINSQKGSADSELILMDMNMPRLNGLEALSVLKADTDTQHIPVLMMSTTSSQELVRKAYEEGINAYIVKPVSSAEFTHLAQSIDVCFLHSNLHIQDTPDKPNLKDTSIMVIEDNKDHLLLIRAAIRQSMPDVQVITMSEEAKVLDFFRTELPRMPQKPHLVLLDLYFPSREAGIDLLQRVREILIMHKLLSIPLIVFSYSDDPRDIHASYQNNANGYMVKGVDIADWESDFKSLHNFWWNTVSLPK